jgi:hypothetical protein
MAILTARYIPPQTMVDGTPVDDQVRVYSENTDGTVSTHLYPQSEELMAWIEEGNEPLPADEPPAE